MTVLDLPRTIKSREYLNHLSTITNVYHISYAPATKETSLFLWGCNMHCRGCICQKYAHNYLLHLPPDEVETVAKLPKRFLDLGEVMQVLDNLEINTVILEGQEASLDPSYPYLTEALHDRYGTRNILCTNAYELPQLKDTDALQVTLKAFTDSLHRHYTGKSNKKVQENFVSLYQLGMKLSVASLLIPDYIDAEEIERIAKFIACIDKDIPYHILSYYVCGDNLWRRTSPEEIDKAVSLAKRHLNKVWGWTGNETMDYEVLKVF